MARATFDPLLWGKTKARQTGTVQVLFVVLGNFGARVRQEHGREPCAEFFILPALRFHFQHYRLQCFSFPVSPYPLNLGGGDSPPNFGGRIV